MLWRFLRVPSGTSRAEGASKMSFGTKNCNFRWFDGRVYPRTGHKYGLKDKGTLHRCGQDEDHAGPHRCGKSKCPAKKEK
jgi:hypothetical protein